MPRGRPRRLTVEAVPGDDHHANRFLLDLTRAAGVLPDRVALAVSGGADSMAMLALATAALPGRIVVATVDHQLRPESAQEAAMVAEHCAAIGIPHATLVPVTPIGGASLQARARDARYALLARWAEPEGAGCIATAHHADDQAETFLMRAARGSGLSGLAGIRQRVEIGGVAVVRPVLAWRRAELRAIVRRAGLAFVDDPTNSDPRHDRTRFRALLEDNEWLDPPAIAEAARHLSEIDADLRATIAWLWDARAIVMDGRVDIDVAGLPNDLRRRLARSAVSEVRQIAAIETPPWSESTGIEPLLTALSGGKGATQAGVAATAKGSLWRFRKAPPRRHT